MYPSKYIVKCVWEVFQIFWPEENGENNSLTALDIAVD